MMRRMHEPDRLIEVDDVTIAVDDRNAAAGGVPLVLVHGYTGSRLDFEDVIDDLATDRRVVAWDHRGHADSTSTGDPSTYTFDRLVADMEGVLHALGIDRIDLLGHSMGGIISMRFALAHPERIRSLVLMDTLAAWEGVIPGDLIQMMSDTAREKGMPAYTDAVVAFEESQDRVPEADKARVVARVRHKMANMDIEAIDALGRALTTFPSMLQALGAVRCPTTVLVGENDTGLLPASDAIAKAIDGAVEVVIPGAAHCPQEERPDLWLAAMRDHLARAEV